MPLLYQFLPGIAASAGVAAALLTLAILWKRLRWAGALAIGLGYASGHVATAGIVRFPPTEATHWLLPFSLAAMLVGVLDEAIHSPIWLRLGTWTLVFALSLFLLLRAKFQYGWSPSEGALWVASFAVGIVLLTCCYEKVSAKSPALALLIAATVAGGTGGALIISGSLLLGQLAMVLTATIAVGAIVAIWFPNVIWIRAFMPVISILLSSLWLSGWFYAELPAISAALLAAASACGLVPLAKEMTMLKSLLVRTALAGVLVACAVGLAFHASPPMDY